MIRDLTIERYRSFRHLEIAGLGRVNLITGRNNSGKSSLLEAIRILAFGAAPSVLYDIVRLREEGSRDGKEARPGLAGNHRFEFSGLFYGFPQFAPDLAPIRIAAEQEGSSLTLAIAMAWLTEERDAEGAPLRLRFVAYSHMFRQRARRSPQSRNTNLASTLSKSTLSGLPLLLPPVSRTCCWRGKVSIRWPGQAMMRRMLSNAIRSFAYSMAMRSVCDPLALGTKLCGYSPLGNLC